MSEMPDNSANPDHPAKTGLRRRVFVFLLVTALTVVLLVSFILTPWGARSLVGLANSVVAELEIDYQGGGLGSELVLNSVSWTDVNQLVAINQLSVSLDLQCVWHVSLCIQSVAAEQVIVNIEPTTTSENNKPAPTLITLPVPIRVDKINLNNGAVTIAGSADMTWQTLSATLSFYKRLVIDNMQLNGLQVTTYATEQTASTAVKNDFDWENWEYSGLAPAPLVIPINFDVMAFKAVDSRLELAGQDTFSIKNVDLTVNGNQQRIKLDKLFVEHTQGQLTATGKIQLDELFEHDLAVNGQATFAGQLPLKLALQSSGNIAGLSAQINVTEVESAANNAQAYTPLRVTTSINGQLDDPNLPLDVQIDWQNLRWPLAQASDDATRVTSAKGELQLSGDLGQFNVALQTSLVGTQLPLSHIELAAVATGQGRRKGFNLQNLSVHTLNGSISSRGDLTLANVIEWQGETTIENIEPSSYWPEIQADINGQLTTEVSNSQGIWQAKLKQLELLGEWQGYPLQVAGGLDYHQTDGLLIHQLTMLNGQNKMSLHGQINPQQNLALQFDLNAPNIADTIGQFGGALEFAGALNGTLRQPEVSFRINGNQLTLSELSVEQVQGQGAVNWNQEKPVNLDLYLAGIQGVDSHLDSAKIQLNGNANLHKLTVLSTGQNTNVEVAIQGQLHQQKWLGKWLVGDINTPYLGLYLPQPFNIKADWVAQEYVIAPHCWQHTRDQLCVKQADFIHDTATWQFSLNDFDILSVGKLLVPALDNIQTDSLLNLDMSGEWQREQLPQVTISASLEAADWQFNAQNDVRISLDKLLFDAQLTEQDIEANLSLSGSGIGKISAKINGQAGLYTEPLTRPIQGNLLIENLNLSGIKELLPQFDELQGIINGTAALQGTLETPLFVGDLRLANGAFKDQSLPVSLSEVQQEIILLGQQAEFSGSYKLGQGLGYLTGDIAWADKLEGSVHLTGEELEFNQQNMLSAKVSPDITLEFSPNNIALSGEVVVPYARVKIQELPKNSISPSDDVILVEQAAERDVTKQRLSLDLWVKVDPQKNNQVKLDSFGLTTDLRGQLKLKNKRDDLFASGDIQLKNGRYRAYGQNLVIRQGDLLFTNTVDKPFLNIEAVRDPDFTEDGVVAGLRIKGDPDSPEVTVFSEPSMEQQQALSYILTGRGFGESSGESQESMLTNALLSLGLGQSENLISKVGNKLGIEDVNLQTSGQGDERQFSLTGTVAPGVQLGYNSMSEVTIRYELMPKLYLEAVSGISTAINIYYRFSVEGKQNRKILSD